MKLSKESDELLKKGIEDVKEGRVGKFELEEDVEEDSSSLPFDSVSAGLVKEHLRILSMLFSGQFFFTCVFVVTVALYLLKEFLYNKPLDIFMLIVVAVMFFFQIGTYFIVKNLKVSFDVFMLGLEGKEE